jgi:uncharacterized membrane protein YdcZ (DUF606 family)
MFLGLIYDAVRWGGWASRPSAWLFYCAGLLGWIALGRALLLAPRVPLRAYPRWVSFGLFCGVSSVVWWHIDSGLTHTAKVLGFMFAFMGGVPILLVVLLLLIALSPKTPSIQQPKRLTSGSSSNG